jgi:hypothetical protein
MTKNRARAIAAAGLAAFAGLAHGAVVSWDGDAGDGYWTNGLNWSANTVPAAGDAVFVTNGAAVILPVGNLPNACTVTVHGASTLNATAGVVRLLNSTINVSTGTLTGGWWDLNGGTLNFQDGAVATMSTWEHKARNTLGFTLSPAGFKTLTPSALRSSGGTVWTNVIFNIDASAYAVSNGGTVVLMDFASCPDNSHTNAFTPTINLVTNPAGPAAALSFDRTNLQLKLIFDVPPPGPRTWDGGGGDSSWTTPANWNPDGVPVAGDNVLVGPGATVTNAQNEFAVLTIGTGATVRFAEYTAAGNAITNAGVIDYAGVFRLTGTPVVTLTGSGSFGAGITWLDTQ